MRPYFTLVRQQRGQDVDDADVWPVWWDEVQDRVLVRLWENGHTRQLKS